MNQDPTEKIALSRFRAIAEVVGPGLEAGECHLLLRQLASLTHELPDGSRREYSLPTLERWLSQYQEHGLDGLRPKVRTDSGSVRRNQDMIEEACRLRQELPTRSADQIARILQLRHGIRVPPRSIRRHLLRRGLLRAALTAQPVQVYGRFQADHANELWIGDFLDGPPLPFPPKPGSRRQTHLFLLLDDYSRLIVHARWGAREDARTAQLVFRQAILLRGKPAALYTDQGAAFVSAALLRTCAVLGIRLIHSRPYRPQGRGKQERVLGTVRAQFLIEAERERIDTLAELNDRFSSWVESAYHHQVHSQTGETPIARYTAHAPDCAVDPGVLFEAFRWSVTRKVNRTAQISLYGNDYQVEPALAGRKVELRFEPEDLSRIEVWYEQQSYGPARPFQITRHVHPRLSSVPTPPTPAPPATTSPSADGQSYLGELQARYEREHFAHLDYRPSVTKEDT